MLCAEWMQRGAALCPHPPQICSGFSAARVPRDLDAVVIGSGIGGLAAAGTLAKVGKRVLVLEQHDQAGGCCHTFQEQGSEFDVGKDPPHHVPVVPAVSSPCPRVRLWLCCRVAGCVFAVCACSVCLLCLHIHVGCVHALCALCVFLQCVHHMHCVHAHAVPVCSLHQAGTCSACVQCLRFL